MNFTIVKQRQTRLNQNELAVLGSNPRFIEKAAARDADVVFLPVTSGWPVINNANA